MAGMTNSYSGVPVFDLDGVPKALKELHMSGNATRKNVIAASNGLYSIRDKLGISDEIVNNAVDIYKKAMEAGLVKNRVASDVMAAAMYAAYKEAGIIKTLKEISIAANIKRKDIVRHYKMLINGLGMDVVFLDPIQCVPLIADLIGASDRVKTYAIEILKKAAESRVTAGKYPIALAATAIYLSCEKNGDPRTGKEIAEAAGISPVTLRTNNRVIVDSIGEWISPKMCAGFWFHGTCWRAERRGNH